VGIYVGEAIGYTGSIGLPLVKDLFFPGVDRLAFFRAFTYVVSLGGAGLLVASGVYFYRRHREPPGGAMDGEDPIEFVMRLFKERGDTAYLGEPVSQTEHALQTAWAAEQAGAGGALVAAAPLHDVGHPLHHLSEACALAGSGDPH